MVTNVTSLTGNGLKDWLIQRVTAIYFGLYTLYVALYFLRHPQMDYQQWHTLFTCKLFQTATIIALLALVLHTWVGIWTVTTDYIKCTAVRITVQMLVALFLLGLFISGIMIVWGQ